MTITKIKEILKIYLIDALDYSNYFIKTIEDNSKTQFALSCFEQACNCIRQANVFYKTNCECRECCEFEEVVSLFSQFSNEFAESYSTNHSLQHTYEYYCNFKEDCKSFLNN